MHLLMEAKGFSQDAFQSPGERNRAWKGSLPTTALRVLPCDLREVLGTPLRRVSISLSRCHEAGSFYFFPELCHAMRLASRSPGSGHSCSQCNKSIPRELAESVWEHSLRASVKRKKVPSPA